jgi:segregation and condensation protein B
MSEETLAIGQELTPEEMVPGELMPNELTTGVDAEESEESLLKIQEVQEAPVLDQELLNKVEAVLFATDKPLHAQAIARIINIDVQLVRQAIIELIEQYESRKTALEIVQDNGYVIEVKPEFSTIMQEFLPLDIPTSLLRTLSIIAIRAPVAQSEIVQMRGASAYDHIRDLVERDLIHKKEEGRSPILSTTKKFQQYFRLSSDGSELRKYVKQQERLLAAQAEERRKREEEAAALAATDGEAQGTEEGSAIAIQAKLPVMSRESIPRTPILEIQREHSLRSQSAEMQDDVQVESVESESSAAESTVPESAELQDFTPDDTGSLTD